MKINNNIEITKYLWKGYKLQVNFNFDDLENSEIFIIDENKQLQPIKQFEAVPSDLINHIDYIDLFKTIRTKYGEITRIQ